MGEEEGEAGKAWEQAGLQTSERNSVGSSSVLLYVHNTKTVRTVRDAHLDFHTAPDSVGDDEVMLNVLRCQLTY